MLQVTEKDTIIIGGSKDLPGTAYGYATRDGGGGYQQTVLGGAYVPVNAADMFLPTPKDENGGVIHLGNGRYEVPKAGNYAFTYEGTMYHSSTGTVGAYFTYGIWNGASYDEVSAAEVGETIRNYGFTVGNNGLYFYKTFTGIALAAQDRIALMVRRSSGGGNLRIASFSLSVCEEE